MFVYESTSNLLNKNFLYLVINAIRFLKKIYVLQNTYVDNVKNYLKINNK